MIFSLGIQIKRGVRHDCVLSPSVLDIYTEGIFKQEELAGLNINGRMMNNIRYADDILQLAENKQELHDLVCHVNRNL